MCRITRSTVSAAIVATVLALCAPAAPAHADPTVPATSTAPFARADSVTWCDEDYGASCSRLQASANASTGGLLVDLAALGTTMWEPAVCPLAPCGYLVYAGAHGRAWVGVTHTLRSPARSVTFMITVTTGQAQATGPAASGRLSAWAAGTCTDCYTSATATIVDGLTGPTASPATRTLTLVYRSSSGRDVPPGQINVTVDLSGDAGGAGSSSVRVPATVTSIASTAQS